MQSLLNGADCSTSSNPLNQVLKREGVDNSLFRDRVGGPGSTSGPISSRPQFRPPAPGPSQGHAHAPVPHPFNLSHLSAALSQSHSPPLPHTVTSNGHSLTHGPPPDLNAEWERFRVASHQAWDRHPHPPPQALHSPPPLQAMMGAPQASAWAESFHQEAANGKGKGRAREYEHTGNYAPPNMGQGYLNGLPPDPFAYSQLPSYQPRYGMYSGAGTGMGMGAGTGGVGGVGAVDQDTVVASGLSAAAHAEMEAAFERALEDARAQSLVEGQAQKKEETKDAQKEGEQVGGKVGDEERGFKGDLEAVWESLKPEAERLNKLAEWEREFSQFTSGEDDTFDILNESLNRDDVGQTPLDEQFELGIPQSSGLMDNPSSLPEFGAYQFVTPNPFIHHSPTAAWSEANRLLATGESQSLSNGALLLESFIQNATKDDYAILGESVSEVAAWCRLGKVQAEDEKEERALSAFEHGRRSLSANNQAKDGQITGELLTNLAISFVNESMDVEALRTLQQFISLRHPSYERSDSYPTDLPSSSPWALHEHVKNAFLSIARDQYQSISSSSASVTGTGAVDPDVQVALGTCYYMMGEYDDARNCWAAALGERPDDYLLWNRLGATLANGGNPEEAVDAYRRALEIKPGFTRAIYNLGVACLNIGVHREAAEHFLAALSLHASELNEPGTSSTQSSSLWATLRRALISLDMPDLAAQARPGTDLNVFRQAGFQF